ncbi:MAG: DUF58 domain-containing protein [Thermoguttaceae bacterium]|nr:DUF58 domain-containing protein [Thermoguttaceae bacterium]
MPNSYFSPETISRIARLQVRARYVVEGFLSGQHRSPFFGSSVDFKQHRQYVPGDDLRNLDWKVLAKQDKFYIKQYEAQTNLNAALIVDSSNSMNYQGAKSAMNKYDYACTAAVSLGHLLLRQSDAVGCARFNADIDSLIPQHSQGNQLDTICAMLEEGQPIKRGKAAMSEQDSQFWPKPVFSRLAQTYSRKGMFFIFSDLFVNRDDLFEGIKALRARGSDVVIFHILDDDEMDFEFSGPTRFEGLEMPQTLRCNPRALRDGYIEALNDYLKEVAKGCAANQVQYNLVKTSTPLDAVLAQALQYGRQ